MLIRLEPNRQADDFNRRRREHNEQGTYSSRACAGPRQKKQGIAIRTIGGASPAFFYPKRERMQPFSSLVPQKILPLPRSTKHLG